MSRLAVYVLGAPRVEVDGEPVHIARRKAIALLVYLAVTRRTHQRDALATLLWPEHDQRSARAELRRTLSVLNRTLGAGYLTADRENAVLNPGADLWLDVRAFRDLLAQCAVHDHAATEACPECLSLLEEAVALYRDGFLAGFTLRDSAAFDEWQFFQTQSLRDALARALERLVGAYSEQGEHDLAISHARRWLSLDPLHEPAHRALMRLYAESGQRAAALRQYRQCVRVLEAELGLAPAEETTALYERIRAERSQPPAEHAPAPSPPPVSLSEYHSEVGSPEAERPVFVARKAELARLDRYLDAALSGRGMVAFVTGDAGRGKTALIAEFARRATEAHPDLLVAWGTCDAYAGLGDPYLPFREVLKALCGDISGQRASSAVSREQARRLWEVMPLAVDVFLEHGDALFDTFVSGGALLSRLQDATSEGAPRLRRLRERIESERAAGGLAQDRLLGQVTEVLRALSERHPLLLCLDDLQWVDAASAGLLFHLGRRLAGSRILIVGAYRPDEVALGRAGERHPLESVLSELKRHYGDVWVDLSQADAREGRAFVDALLDSEPNRLGDVFRGAMYRRTGGHPLFTVELLRAMQARGDLVHDAEGCWVEGPALHWEHLPARVEAVIEERIARLSPELREVLSVASVEGEAFSAQTVAIVQGVGERELIRKLSRDLERRHHLVQEEGIVLVDGRRLSRYRFAHALYQEHLYKDLGKSERALLHTEVAEALEGLYASQMEGIVAQLARHYAEAGDAERAVMYLNQAGDRARLAYAHQEAVEHYRRALAFLKAQGQHERAARTLMKLGLTHHVAYRFVEAREAYTEAFALWQPVRTAATARSLRPAPHALRMDGGEPVVLDPTLSIDTYSGAAIRALFSNLVLLDVDLNVVPDVAARWHVKRLPYTTRCTWWARCTTSAPTTRACECRAICPTTGDAGFAGLQRLPLASRTISGRSTNCSLFRCLLRLGSRRNGEDDPQMLPKHSSLSGVRDHD